MKLFRKLELEVLELEEDIVRTSGSIGGGESSGGAGNGLEDSNKNDDIIDDWGS